MNLITLNDLTPSESFEKTLYLDKNSIILLENIPLDKDQIEILQKWNLNKFNLEKFEVDHIQEEKSVKQADIYFLKNYQLLKKTINQFIHVLENFYITVKRINISQNINEQQIQSKKNRFIEEIEKTFPIFVQNKQDLILLVAKLLIEKDSYEIESFYIAIFSLFIGLEMKMDKKRLLVLFFSALLSNLGMSNVDSIIQKNNITDQEKNKIKKHPVFSYDIIVNKLKFPKIYGVIAICHHENYNGSGYPRKLKEEKIPIFSSIINVAESYTAMVCSRPYCKRISPHIALKKLISLAGTHYHPKVIQNFFQVLSYYPVGSLVKLNDERIGLVADTNNVPLKPKIFVASTNNVADSIDVLDLRKENNIFIQSIIDNVERTKAFYKKLNL